MSVHLRKSLAAGVGLARLAIPPPAAASPAAVTLSTDWQQYVAAPASSDVSPVRVLTSTGNVTNPQGLLTGQITKLARSAPAPKPAWPGGTAATASSFHDPNTNNGQPRTYVPGNAIDGNTTTFWNDANADTYPAVL